MKRSILAATAVASTLAGAQQQPTLIAHYPFRDSLDDATGRNPPAFASNAPFVEGKALYCSGRHLDRTPDPCVVRTPELEALDRGAFTISAQFLVPRMRFPSNPVFVLARESWRPLSFELQRDGTVRLGHAPHGFAPCTVEYRTGAWHEATISFDGRTARLYLDGVEGCSVTAPLRTDRVREVLLTDSGNGTTYHGFLRDLKLYNGVVVPAPRTPVEDGLAEPAPTDLAPVDLFLAKCPTPAEVASVDRDLKLAFDSDPTRGEPRACSAAQGSQDLSPLQRRVYNTLLLMKQLQFDRPLPWTDQQLYRWFTKAVRGVRFRSDIKASSCCDRDRSINFAIAYHAARYTDRWAEPVMGAGLDALLLVLVHEARHAERKPHTCGTKDTSLQEMGSWAVQYYLARWLLEHTDQAFFTSGATRHTEWLRVRSEELLKHQFCRP